MHPARPKDACKAAIFMDLSWPSERGQKLHSMPRRESYCQIRLADDSLRTQPTLCGLYPFSPPGVQEFLAELLTDLLRAECADAV
jgi:hypothetical protein